MKFTRGNWKLEFEDIGEGLSGDYDEEDPNDIPLLRADLSYKDHGCEDGSYCTLIPVDCPREKIQPLADLLFDALEAEHPNGKDVHWLDTEELYSFHDRVMQRWTWSEPDWKYQGGNITE